MCPRCQHEHTRVLEEIVGESDESLTIIYICEDCGCTFVEHHDQFCVKYRTKEEANNCSGYMYTSTGCNDCIHNLSI